MVASFFTVICKTVRFFYYYYDAAKLRKNQTVENVRRANFARREKKISENLFGGIEHFVYFCKQKLYLFPLSEN